MAFDTYSGLLAEVASRVDRTDLTALIPGFIRLFEAEASRELDCRQMEELASITANAETASLPCGFRGVKAIRLQTSPVQPLTYVKADHMDGADPSSGKPVFYSIIGDNLIFDPVPDTTYTVRLRYRSAIPALSASNPTNWLLEQHPDAYLFGAVEQAHLHLMDEARAAAARGKMLAVLEQINADERRQAGTANARGRAF